MEFVPVKRGGGETEHVHEGWRKVESATQRISNSNKEDCMQIVQKYSIYLTLVRGSTGCYRAFLLLTELLAPNFYNFINHHCITRPGSSQTPVVVLSLQQISNLKLGAPSFFHTALLFQSACEFLQLRIYCRIALGSSKGMSGLKIRQELVDLRLYSFRRDVV